MAIESVSVIIGLVILSAIMLLLSYLFFILGQLFITLILLFIGIVLALSLATNFLRSGFKTREE
jgi:CHASE2 domain-containing sensor protein